MANALISKRFFRFSTLVFLAQITNPKNQTNGEKKNVNTLDKKKNILLSKLVNFKAGIEKYN